MCEESVNNSKCQDDGRAELKKLISEAQSGCQTAYTELLRRYDPLITSMAGKSLADGMTEQDFEDLKQEAAFYFCIALSTYDMAQDEVEFGLYAKICIGNALKSVLRSYNRRIDKLFLISDEEWKRIDSQIPSDDDFIRHIIEKEEYYRLYMLIKYSLTPLENSVWWMYVSGISVQKIAAELSISQKSVSNAVYRIRRKLKSIIGNEM